MSDWRWGKQVGKYKPMGHPGSGGYGWKIFDGGTGSTLPIPWWEDDNFYNVILSYLLDTAVLRRLLDLTAGKKDWKF